jgi:hypothetical protein
MASNEEIARSFFDAYLRWMDEKLGNELGALSNREIITVRN